MAIIGILSTIVLANYNNFGARQEVKNAAAELKSNLRKYQTYALAGHKNPLGSSPAPCGTAAIDYYSVSIDNTSSPMSYYATLKCGPNTVDLPSVDLPDSITTFEVQETGGSACGSPILRFLPLTQGVYLDCGGTVQDEVLIHLENSAAPYDVHVTSSGEMK
jgi:type II secretory pathway pseudopilin PulG